MKKQPNYFKDLDKYIDLIKKSKNIAIISHVNPDGDTLGSGLATYTALSAIGKNVSIFCHDKPSIKYRSMPNIEKYNTDAINDKFDLAISVDCSTFDRLGTYKNVFKKATNRVVIDHHITNTKYGTLNLIDGTAAATAEMIYYSLIKLEESFPNIISDQVAELIYTGIVTDTGCFAFSSVTSQTHDIASKLINFNFDSAAICNRYVNSIDYNVFRLKQRCINNARFYSNNRIVISVYTQKDFDETNTDMSLTDGIIQNLINISSTVVAITLTEISKYSYKASIRSKESFDSAKFAEWFGGGGHVRAAGCQFDGHLEDIIEKIIKACEDHFDS